MYAQVSTQMAKLWEWVEDKSTLKWGLGAGLGVVNPIFKSQFYYSIGFNVTRYFTGQNIIFERGGIDMTTGIWSLI